MPKKNISSEDNLSQYIRQWLKNDRQKRTVIATGRSHSLEKTIFNFIALLDFQQRQALHTYLAHYFHAKIEQGTIPQYLSNTPEGTPQQRLIKSLNKEGSKVSSGQFRTIQGEISHLLRQPDNQQHESLVFILSFGMTGEKHHHRIDRPILEKTIPSIDDLKPKEKVARTHFISKELATHNTLIARESSVDRSVINFATAWEKIENFFKNWININPRNKVKPKKSPSHPPVSNKDKTLIEQTVNTDVIADSSDEQSDIYTPILPKIIITPAKSNDSVDASDGLDSCDDDDQQQLELEKQRLENERLEREKLEQEKLRQERIVLEQEKSDRQFAISLLHEEEQTLLEEQKTIESDALLAQELSTQLNEEQTLEQAPLDTDAILAFQEQIKNIIQLLAANTLTQSAKALRQRFELVNIVEGKPSDTAQFMTSSNNITVLLYHNESSMLVHFNDSIFVNKLLQQQTRDIDAKIENVDNDTIDAHWMSSAFGDGFHYQQTSDIRPSLADHGELLFYQTPQANSCGLEAKVDAEEYNNGLIY